MMALAWIYYLSIYRFCVKNMADSEKDGRMAADPHTPAPADRGAAAGAAKVTLTWLAG